MKVADTLRVPSACSGLSRHTECAYYNGSRHSPNAVRQADSRFQVLPCYGTRSVPTTMFELFDPKSDFCIHSGSNLPHWYQPGVSYFVTFRTEDSIPADVSRRWHAQRSEWLLRHKINANAPDWKKAFAQLPEIAREEFHDKFSREYLEYLDKGLGECLLRQREYRQIVADSLLHFDGDRYYMGDFVVMPNHVHAIVGLLGDTEIESQCTSWKRYSARKINQAIARSGRFWQEESFDHLIRSPAQFDAIQQYIRNNPKHLHPSEYVHYQKK